MTANDKYPLQGYENLLTPVQMQLSWKLKPFLDIFVAISETKLDFEDLEKKDDRNTCFISEITDCQKLGKAIL